MVSVRVDLCVERKHFVLFFCYKFYTNMQAVCAHAQKYSRSTGIGFKKKKKKQNLYELKRNHSQFVGY